MQPNLNLKSVTPKAVLYTFHASSLKIFRDYAPLSVPLLTIQKNHFLLWISCLIVLRYSVFDEEYFIKLLKISSQAQFLVTYFSLKYTFLFILIQNLFKGIWIFENKGKEHNPQRISIPCFFIIVLYTIF